VDEHVEGEQITTVFFDESGQPESHLRQVVVSGTLTHPATGMVVTGVHEAATFDRDFTTGTVATHRLRLIVTVPGIGVVILDAGTLVTDAGGVFKTRRLMPRVPRADAADPLGRDPGDKPRGWVGHVRKHDVGS
jgi:hypothetical protein